MIVIDRRTGERMDQDALTQAQTDELAFRVFAAMVQLHPDVIQAAVAEYLAAAEE